VLTSMCARLYGRRGARNRAMRAMTATKREPGAA
jgi:putative resolvase